MTDNDEEMNREDQIVTVKLPRSQARILRRILEREETYSNITASMKSSWVFVVAAGILTVFSLWDTIKALLIGVK